MSHPAETHITKTDSHRGASIGILGGGQLSVFLIEAAHRLGRKTRVLLTDANEPAAVVSDEVVMDKIMMDEPVTDDGTDNERFRQGVDESSIRRFLSGLEVVLFESENIDLSRFEALFRDSVFFKSGISESPFSESPIGGDAVARMPRFVPSLAAMRILQDKAAQKRLLTELDIPTARFAILLRSENTERVDRLDTEFPPGWILKRARGGYDGRGNYLGAKRDEAIAFLAMAAREGVDVYAEERVSIRRELAIVATRSADGTFLPYPVVGSTQTRGVCDFVEGPARNFDLAPEREARVVEFARRIAERTTYVGTFAIEFFETSEGDLLVNEIAPRVHNSGHYTLDAARTSQFEQHLRAALGMPLGSVETSEYFRMKNCLGPAGVTSDRGRVSPKVETSGRVRYYDYGKTAIRPGRKMGHLTIAGVPSERVECTKALEAAHEKWIAEVMTQ